MDRGNGYLHGGPPIPPSSVKREVDHDPPKTLSVWKAKSDGSICCPTGGCGSAILELRCMFQDGMVQELVRKASSVVTSTEFPELPDFSMSCSCFSSSSREIKNCRCSRKSADRKDSPSNYLYCLTTRDGEQEELEHFQKHWTRGEPVIVHDVFNSTYNLSWEPMVMWRALREMKTTSQSEKNVNVINCLDLCKVSLHFAEYV